MSREEMGGTAGPRGIGGEEQGGLDGMDAATEDTGRKGATRSEEMHMREVDPLTGRRKGKAPKPRSVRE